MDFGTGIIFLFVVLFILVVVHIDIQRDDKHYPRGKDRRR